MNKKNQPVSPTLDELDWLAFQYVADELSGEAKSDFERRLETDQVARDAVERAVELGQVTWQALAQPSAHSRRTEPGKPRTSRTSRTGWKSWYILAGTVLVLLMGAWWMVPTEPSVAEGGDDNDSLAVAWADVVADEVELTEVDLEMDELGTDLIDLDETSWMIAALAEMELEEGILQEGLGDE